MALKLIRQGRAYLGARLGPNSGRRALAADTVYVLGIQLISRGIVQVVTILAANFLTVAQFGAYSYYLVTINLIGAAVGVGLPMAVTKALAASTPERAPNYEALLGAIAWIFGGACMVALAVSPLLYEAAGLREYHVGPAMMMVGALTFAWFGIMHAGMQGAGAFKHVLVPVTIGSAVLLLFCGWSYAVQATEPLMIGLILSFVLPGLLFGRYLRRHDLLPWRALLSRPNRSAVREIGATALPSLGNAVIFAGVNWWIARSLIEHQSNPDGFVHFAVGMQWFSLALFVPLAVGQALFPTYVRMSRDRQMSLSATVQPALLAFALVALASLVAVPATPLLSLIYGENFSFSIWFVLAIMAAASLSAPAGVLGQSIIAQSGAAMWLKLYMVFLTLGVGLPLVWPPRDELAAATILAIVNAGLVVTAAAYLWLLQRRRRRRAAAPEPLR